MSSGHHATGSDPGPSAPGGVIVRRVRASDFDAIATLTNHYIATTPIHFATEPVTPGSLRESWEKTSERYPFLVAEVAPGLGASPGAHPALLGYAKAGVWRERAAYGWTPETGIYVRPDGHGRGIGRALYARLFTLMTAQGFRSIVAGVTLPNAASVRLHESIGFVAQGVIRQAGWKFDRWWDVGFWQKRLIEDDSPASSLLSVTRAESVVGP